MLGWAEITFLPSLGYLNSVTRFGALCKALVKFRHKMLTKVNLPPCNYFPFLRSS